MSRAYPEKVKEILVNSMTDCVMILRGRAEFLKDDIHKKTKVLEHQKALSEAGKEMASLLAELKKLTFEELKKADMDDETIDLMFMQYLDGALISFEQNGVPEEPDRLRVYRDSFRAIVKRLLEKQGPSSV